MPAKTTGAPAADASGVGPVTALATEVFLRDPSRCARGNQVASYIGMIPCEHSSGKRQRLGKMTKEGNSLLRYLWTENPTDHQVRPRRFGGRVSLWGCPISARRYDRVCSISRLCG
jgi:transposase